MEQAPATRAADYHTENPDRATENSAVARCLRAWRRAYNKELANLPEGEDDFEACRAGKKAYLRAMPPLAGFQNVSDFMACLTYGLIVETIRQDEAAPLQEAAKIALAIIRSEPKTPKSVED